MNLKNLFFTLTLCAFAAGCASDENVSGYASNSDENFVHMASIGNHFEVVTSEVALQKSRNPEVRRLARRMVDDHTRADSQLRIAVASSNVDTNAVAADLDLHHQRLLSDLKETSGRSFDEQYLSMQLDAHNDAIRLFRDYSDNGQDRDLRKFAAGTLPALERHAQRIEKIKL